MSIRSKKEQTSEKNAFSSIKMTANSGRSKNDGDFHTDDITFDNKLQSKSKDWKVTRFELDKVRVDATRSGRKFGALHIENSLGRKVVVMDADEFTELLTFYGIVE